MSSELGDCAGYTEIDVYKRLINRRDAWSKQKLRPDEKGRFGYTTQNSELTDDLLRESLLENNVTIGTYTVTPLTNLVVNPTIDIDNHDGNIEINCDVNIIYKALKDAGMFPYIEASAGELKDGAHIGVICKPTQAIFAKAAIEAIIAKTGLKHEVNPKQETVEEGRYGNLVKLPFQYNNRTKARSQIINPETFELFSREDAIAYMMGLQDTVFPDVIVEAVEEEQVYKAEKAIRDARTHINTNTTGATFKEQYKVATLPCIMKCYDEKWALHGKSGTHEFRLAVAGHLIFEGVSDELVIQYFQDQKDFSRYKTENQIRSTHKYLDSTGKPPMGCKKIKKLCQAIVGDTCTGCPNNRVKEAYETKQTRTVSGDFFTDKGRFIVKNLGDYILSQRNFIAMMDNPRELYVYDNGVYVRATAEMTVRTMATELLGERIKRNYVDETVYYIQTLSAIRRDRVNSDYSIINVKNGLYNINTRKLDPHTTEFLSTQQIPVDYDPTAKCQIISKFLLDILPFADVVLVLQMFGYLLIPNRDIQKAFMFTGGGSNGKGTLTRLLIRFIGSTNCSRVSLQNLNTDKFAASNLYGKLANICPDLASEGISEDAVFKAITGKDELRGERKYEEPFDFAPV